MDNNESNLKKAKRKSNFQIHFRLNDIENKILNDKLKLTNLTKKRIFGEGNIL